MKRFLMLGVLLSFLATPSYAFDIPLLGLFCQGTCAYSGAWTYNDPNGVTTSTVSATATGNLGGNSGNISGSLFTQWGGGCFYSLNGDPGCTGLIYVFPAATNGGCVPNLGGIFHFCYQGPGQTCQGTFSGSWNATSSTSGAYINIAMQTDVAVNLNVNGQCPAGRPDILTLDLASVPFADCDGSKGKKGLPIPPFYCNEMFSVVPPSFQGNNVPITGSLDIAGERE